MAHDVFISHSSKDKQAADAICHALENNGVKCWIAPRDVSAGFEYAEEIMSGIENCKIFLLIFSKDANISNPVAKEVENAFRYGKTVIPFRIEDVVMRKSLEYYLSNLHWLDAFPDDKEFDALVKAVKNALGVETPSISATAPAPPPISEAVKEFCMNCGNPYTPNEDIFCLNCGAKNGLAPIKEFCMNCGNPHTPREDIFCLNCGVKLQP